MRRRSFWRPYVVAAVMVAGLALVTYFSFNPGVPFRDGYRIDAVFESSSGLRKGSPVRVAGVDVGEVVSIGKGPGHTTAVTMEIDEAGRPVHRDATARIRPRVFLEGGYVVDLQPGSPGAEELPDDGTIPLPQTATPVQLHEVLGTFERPARDSLRGILDTFAEGLDEGGAQGLAELAPELAPLLRDVAWVSDAARGERGDDLGRLIASTDRITRALDTEQLGDLVDNLATTARALHDRDRRLAASIAETSRTLAATPRALASVRAALPRVERAVGQVRPAVDIAPRALDASTRALRDLGSLVAPARRQRTIRAMETAFRDLPLAVQRLAGLFPTVKPLTDCLSSHILPTFSKEVPDGELSTGRPVWQDFVHGLVGLSSAAQNFDGNGYALRYQFGLEGSTLSTQSLPGLGRLVTRGPSNVRSRPLPRKDRKPPPQDPGAPCSEQPVPSLDAPTGSAGLNVIPSDEGAGRARIAEADLRRLLDPARLRRLLRPGREGAR